MRPTEEETRIAPDLPPIEIAESSGQIVSVPPGSAEPAGTDRRQPPVTTGETENPEFPLNALPGWAACHALEFAELYGLNPEALVAGSLAITGGLLGPALQIDGLDSYPRLPVIHTMLIMPASPLARQQFARQLLPVLAVLERQARLKDQPRLADSFEPSANEQRFGRAANPTNPIIPRKNPLDRLGPKPGLLACSPDREHIKFQAGRSLDRHLFLDGTGVRFGQDLLDLPQKEWIALLGGLEAGFHRSLLQPEKHSARLAALWTLDRREAGLVWERMTRGGRRPPPFLVVDAAADDGKLSTDLISKKPQDIDKWHQWSECILRYRTGASPQPIRTFSRRARAGLVSLHNELIDVEKMNPVARACGVDHFLAVAERTAGLFSLNEDEAEIADENVGLALRLTRFYLDRHLRALGGLMGRSIPSSGSPQVRGRSLEDVLLNKIGASSTEGLTIRDLVRAFHRGPDTATIRVVLQKLEISGAVCWKDDRVVGVSAPTNEAEDATPPSNDCDPLPTTDSAETS